MARKYTGSLNADLPSRMVHNSRQLLKESGVFQQRDCLECMTTEHVKLSITLLKAIT